MSLSLAGLCPPHFFPVRMRALLLGTNTWAACVGRFSGAMTCGDTGKRAKIFYFLNFNFKFRPASHPPHPPTPHSTLHPTLEEKAGWGTPPDSPGLLVLFGLTHPNIIHYFFCLYAWTMTQPTGLQTGLFEDCCRLFVVSGEEGARSCIASSRSLYTRDSLASLLRLCLTRPRHAAHVSARVFEALVVLSRRGGDAGRLPRGLPRSVARGACFGAGWASLPRACFEAMVLWALAEFRYAKPGQAADVRLACSVHERRRSVVLLLCGTSGTGKSTLAALLAARMGINAVMSTDSLRGVMRSLRLEESPLLFASTYDAGQLVEVPPEAEPADPAAADRKRTVRGYKAQSELVLSRLEGLLGHAVSRGESLVIEGAHLNLSLVVPMMSRHPGACILPFLVTIGSEAKHRERFAVRAKHMSLLPESNRYVKYFRQIRQIADYLDARAAKHGVPRVNNTNVDRSVDVIHAAAFGTLRRAACGGEDCTTPAVLSDEFATVQARQTTALIHDFVKMLTVLSTQAQRNGPLSSKAVLLLLRGRQAARLRADAARAPALHDSVGTAEGDREEHAASGARTMRHGRLSSDDDEGVRLVGAARTDESEPGSVAAMQSPTDNSGDEWGTGITRLRLATLEEG